MNISVHHSLCAKKLENVSNETVNFLHVTNGYKDPIVAKVLSVYDGDTCRVAIVPFLDSNLEPVKVDVRMMGIDTPELRDPLTKDWATTVKNHVANLVEHELVWLVVDCGGKQFRNDEKYANRILGNIYPMDENEKNEILKNAKGITKTIDDLGDSISEILIKKGYARPYDGKTKQFWTSFPLQKPKGQTQRDLLDAIETPIGIEK